MRRQRNPKKRNRILPALLAGGFLLIWPGLLGAASGADPAPTGGVAPGKSPAVKAAGVQTAIPGGTASPAVKPPAAQPTVGTPASVRPAVAGTSQAVASPSKPAASSPGVPPAVRERPDPFKPFIQVEKEAAQKAAAAASAVPPGKPTPAPLSPLQRIGLDQFKLLGCAGDERRRTAVVEAMEGGKKKYFSLQVGTLIGQNGGKVVEIGADRIVVEEREMIGPGRTKANRIAIRIRENEVKP